MNRVSLPVKKLFIPVAVITIVTGCVANKPKTSASTTVLTADSSPVIYSVGTNAVIIPNSYTVKLDNESQKTLIDAIKSTGNKPDGSIQVVLTNANLVILNSTFTNPVSFPNSMLVNLDEPTHRALQDATVDKWFKKELFFSSLLGAAVAVLAGFILHRIEVGDIRREDKEFVRNVLKSIEAELDALSGIFNQGIGGKLKERKGRMFLVRLALSQDYFTVYVANAVHLGKVQPKMARAIISLYQTLKQLIENFRINNEYIQMHDAVLYQWKTTFAIRPEGLTQRAFELEELLNQQGDELVRLSESVEQQYKALKKTFEEFN
jgi:hypothetical protein